MKKSIDIHPLLPLTQTKVMKIAQTASKFKSTITIEGENVVLNLKSMIGLLSQKIPANGQVTLVFNGEDEQEAGTAIEALFETLAKG